MKTQLSLIFTFLTLSSFGQGFNKLDTLQQPPAEVKKLITKTITQTLKVDFTGDGKQDFICQAFSNSKTPGTIEEYWISSDFQLIKKKKKYATPFDYLWLVNIDNDPEPELFSATGDEDGIDYVFYDQNLKTKEDNILFYVHPVIIENNKYYWGYPWDIKNIILKIENKKIYLKASLDHNITRDGNISTPNSQKKIPVLFFYGHSTQPESKVEEIRNINWTTIEKLK